MTLRHPRIHRTGLTPQQLADARRRKDLTQERLAKLLEISVWKVCDWERGRTYPRPDVLAKLEQLLDLAVVQ